MGAIVPVGGPVLRNTTDILEHAKLIDSYMHLELQVSIIPYFDASPLYI